MIAYSTVSAFPPSTLYTGQQQLLIGEWFIGIADKIEMQLYYYENVFNWPDHVFIFSDTYGTNTNIIMNYPSDSICVTEHMTHNVKKYNDKRE